EEDISSARCQADAAQVLFGSSRVDQQRSGPRQLYPPTGWAIGPSRITQNTSSTGLVGPGHEKLLQDCGRELNRLFRISQRSNMRKVKRNVVGRPVGRESRAFWLLEALHLSP